MNPATLLMEAGRRGIRLWPDGESLRVNGPKGSIDPGFRSELARHKPALLRLLVEPEEFRLVIPDDWPAGAIEDFQERAAIMEFDGGLPRDQAEREAFQVANRRLLAANRNDCRMNSIVDGFPPAG